MEEEEGGMKAMTLRLPDELAKEIEAEARAAHRSIHAHILWLVEGALRIRALVEAWPRREVLEKMSPEEFEAYQTRLIATGLADPPFDAPKPPTPDDNLPTLVESGAASRGTQRSQCVCPAEMVRKGKHLRQCTART
jgi:predicted transcriptional regulator